MKGLGNNINANFPTRVTFFDGMNVTSVCTKTDLHMLVVVNGSFVYSFGNNQVNFQINKVWRIRFRR
jgi:alpha-tubulin suppressor-like RCC1 family protein